MTRYMLLGLILIFGIGFYSGAQAHQTMVYCQNQYGQIFTFPNTCPAGMKFVGVKG